MGGKKRSLFLGSVDLDGAEKQLEALLSSSFCDEYPEECDGIVNLLGAIADGCGDDEAFVVEVYEGSRALVCFVGKDGLREYSGVLGYDARTGTWAEEEGWRTTSLFDAWERANPRVVEGAGIVWEREDFAEAFENMEVLFDEKDIDRAIDEANLGGCWKEDAISRGNDAISFVAAAVAKEREKGC